MQENVKNYSSCIFLTNYYTVVRLFLFGNRHLMPGMGWIIIFFVIIIAFSIRIIKPRQAAVVKFLGKPSRVIRTWLNFIIPILETIDRQTIAMINLSVKVDGITKDNVQTSVDINVIYSVKDDDQSIIDSLYKNLNIVQTIKSLVEEQLRAQIFAFEHEEIFGKRSDIGEEIRETLSEKLAQFGMELDSVQVIDIQLDNQVVIAMNKVVASQKNKTAAVTEAEAQKQAQILAAEADKEVKRLIGEGMAAQREAIAKWFRDSIQQIKDSDPALQGKEILAFLLDSSRIETLEKVGAHNAKVIYVNENLEGKQASLIQGA